MGPRFTLLMNPVSDRIIIPAKHGLQKGQTPVAESTGARFSVNMIAAIDTRGSIRFMTSKGTIDGEKLCEFLKKLMHESEGPVFLIWDSHPTNRSKKVKDCVDLSNDRLKIYFSPFILPN